MGLFSRHKPQPLTGLHKDSETPMGAIWSVSAPTPAMEHEYAAGDLLDRDRVLQTGDVITVRATGTGRKRFSLRVTGRDDDVVHCERIWR